MFSIYFLFLKFLKEKNRTADSHKFTETIFISAKKYQLFLKNMF